MNIEQEVKQIVCQQLGIDATSIQNESKFINDLGADSLDTVELIMKIEDHFKLEIGDVDAENINTVQDAIDYVQSHT